MSKVFQKNQGPDVNVKRNTFDLSFASHITGNIGDLIPCYCQEVIPGDSFQIDPKFGLRFNPTVFPIESKMHGIMHFFYVRNRNLHNKWQEYITRTDEDIVHPYLHITENSARAIIGTGSLGDYLGVPSTVTGDYARFITCNLNTFLYAESAPSRAGSPDAEASASFATTPLGLINRKTPMYIYVPNLDSQYVNNFVQPYWDITNWRQSANLLNVYENPSWLRTYGYMSVNRLEHPIKDDFVSFSGGLNVSSSSSTLNKGAYLLFTLGEKFDSPISQTEPCLLVPVTLTNVSGKVAANLPRAASAAIEELNSHIGSNAVYCGVLFAESVESSVTSWQTPPTVLSTDSSFICVADSISFNVVGSTVLDATDSNTVLNNPFVIHGAASTPKIKLNALPFRAYESIYNYFYRDETVDPFRINGKAVYNDFIPTHESGADAYPYRIHRRNWERDYYTSCQTSPQQGTAPLVGVSASGTFTFSDGTNTYTAQATIGDDGETITGISTYSPDMPKGSLRQLMDTITNGISINDFRNVNSLQRWLETNIRRGYKYVDQIFSHFGINPAFKANDMPEFLGGIHAVADVNQINNYSADGLGEYVGQLSMFGGSQNKISKFCDEHGFIIGIMCVFPEPVYSQMLPKHFIKTQTPLDYFFPEFGHIGMQPITYNEVTPLEVAASDAVHSTDTLNDVFGYQRAWADYLANFDQVHGDFRTSLNEFVAQRVFNDKPELGHDFIAIDPSDINDIFITTDGSNKMLGELRFSISAQRPIPMFGIPRLE